MLSGDVVVGAGWVPPSEIAWVLTVWVPPSELAWTLTGWVPSSELAWVLTGLVGVSAGGGASSKLLEWDSGEQG